MKKSLKILFSIVMALIFVLPFAAFGCQVQQNSNSQTNVELTVKTNLYNHLSKIRYTLTREIPYELEDVNIMRADQYRVITYGYFVNDGGGFDTYTMYVGKTTTYIMKGDHVYGKIYNGDFYSATTTDGVVSYTNYGTVGYAKGNGYRILTSGDLIDFATIIKKCTYLYFDGYLLNLDTGVFVQEPNVFGSLAEDEIHFYREYEDFAFNNSFAEIDISSKTIDGVVNYEYTIMNYPHIYFNDNTLYDATFFYLETSDVKTITKSELPAILKA